MPTKPGKCPLCKRRRQLHDSHFIGRAIYKKLGADSLPNRNPVIVTSGLVDQSQSQLKDYAFCSDCESIFNLRGESWVHKHIATYEDYKLLELFNGVTPALKLGPNFNVFDGDQVPGLEFDKLFHYGLGVFFKAATRVWHVDGNIAHITLNWEAREALRKAVYGNASLPKTMRMTIAIASQKHPFLGMITPDRMQEPGCLKFVFYVPGIFYTLFVGKRIPEMAKNAAAIRGIEKPIYLMPEASDNAKAIMKILSSTGLKSSRVQTLMKIKPPPRP
jgi:hypothetical protein